MDLRIVCTGAGRAAHATVELAVASWTPKSLNVEGFAIWSPDTPLRDMELRMLGESARATKSERPNKVVRRAAVEQTTRADGGATFLVPGCPRCGRPPLPLRDDTLRTYAEKTRDTPVSGTLDVAHVRLM